MKVLIADDSRGMRMIVSRALRQANLNAEVIEASNGVEALAAIEASPIDLVLCDWNMPEMTGLELLRQLRERNINVRFGFVTSESTASMRQIALDAGALFLIIKPFTSETFAEQLRKAL